MMHWIGFTMRNVYSAILTATATATTATIVITVHRNMQYRVSLNAKHVENKAARKAAANRPKKSRPSDINRKPVVYPSFEKPAEYTISDATAVLATKPE